MSVTMALFLSAGVAMTWGIVATCFAVWSKHHEDAQWRRRPRARR